MPAARRSLAGKSREETAGHRVGAKGPAATRCRPALCLDSEGPLRLLALRASLRSGNLLNARVPIHVRARPAELARAPVYVPARTRSLGGNRPPVGLEIASRKRFKERLKEKMFVPEIPSPEVLWAKNRFS